MRRMTVGSLVLAICLAIVLRNASALTPAQRTQIAQSVGTISAVVGNEPRMGTCLVVSDQGYVATSLRLLQGATGANVVLRDGTKHEVAGVVAARKGKDLAILMLRNPKGMPPALTLAAQNLAPGDAVEVIGSETAKPYDFSQGKFVRHISGRELLAGLDGAGSAGQRVDPDLCLLRSDTLQPPRCLGAALLNSLGEVAGMITYVPAWGERMHTAVHAAHLADLLDGVERVRPTPLAGLKKLLDSRTQELPANATATPATRELAPLRADVTAQLAAWRKQQDDLVENAKQLKESVQGFQEKLKLQQANSAALAANYATLNGKLRGMKPEERYTVKVRVEKKDKDGEIRYETKDKVDYRYSRRQEQERAALRTQLNTISGNMETERLNGLRLDSWVQQCGLDQAAITRQSSRQWTELFYLADPWCLRKPEVHRALEQSLTEAMDAGENSAALRLARGVARHNLWDFEEAVKDFDAAARLDSQLADVARACEARALLQTDKVSEGKKLLAQVARAGVKDPHIAVVQALVELDSGHFASVERQLLKALERGADPAEIHRVLALLLAASPEGQPRSARRALDHARQACGLTANLDSEALLSLAAAQAEGGDFDEAEKVAAQAIALAAGEVRDRAQDWRQKFLDEERLQLRWGQ